MLFEHPFIVAMLAGVSRSVRIMRWEPDIPEKQGHCSVECQTAVTDDIMNVVRDQVEGALRQQESANAMMKKALLAISSGWAERFHPTPPSSIYERDASSSSEDEKPSLASLAKFIPAAPPPPTAPVGASFSTSTPTTRLVRSISPQPLKPVAQTRPPSSLSMLSPAQPSVSPPLVFGQKTPGYDTPPGLSMFPPLTVASPVQSRIAASVISVDL